MKRHERARLRRTIKHTDARQYLRILYAAMISAIILLVAVIKSPAMAASNTAGAKYPIAELGGCKNAKECELYCEIPEHMPACWSYGTYILKPKTTTSPTQYPISELGNCTSARSCYEYCSKPTNYATCFAYGKKEKLLTVEQLALPVLSGKVLTAAAADLGCDSPLSCMILCAQPSYADRCELFTQTYMKPRQSVAAQPKTITSAILKSAKKELGCETAGSCLELCTIDANKSACTEFGIATGLVPSPSPTPFSIQDLSREPAGTVGCATNTQCQEYCKNHPDECPGFKQAADKTKVGYFIGPSGCSNEAECKAYCELHQDQCPGYTSSTSSKQPMQAEALMKDKVSFRLKAAGL